MTKDEARKFAGELATQICGCANRDQHRRDVALILAYRDAALVDGIRLGLEAAADRAGWDGCYGNDIRALDPNAIAKDADHDEG